MYYGNIDVVCSFMLKINGKGKHSMKILIQNGYVLDPESKREGIFDVLVQDEKIVKVAEKIETEADRVIDATGSYVMPGFIDLHVHLREPGFEYKETIKTGSMAAAAGGYTTICPMPNTKPAIGTYIISILLMAVLFRIYKI